jgi:hypothetical protein
MSGVEMQSPDPADLAEHWGRIIGVVVSKGADGTPELKLPNATLRFAKGAADIMSGLDFRVGNVARVLDAAKARGYGVEGNAFAIGGVNFRLSA